MVNISKTKQNNTLKSFLLYFLRAKSSIKSSKLIWCNKSASIMSRDKYSNKPLLSHRCSVWIFYSLHLFERMSFQLCSLWPLMLKIYVFIIGRWYITTVQYHCNYYALPLSILFICFRRIHLHPYLKGLFKNKGNWYLIMWPLALRHYMLNYVHILGHPISSVLSWQSFSSSHMLLPGIQLPLPHWNWLRRHFINRKQPMQQILFW